MNDVAPLDGKGGNEGFGSFCLEMFTFYSSFVGYKFIIYRNMTEFGLNV